MVKFIHRRLSRDEHGATAVEYGLMVSFIAIGVFAAVVLLGSNLSSFFSTAATSL
jgi:pilus assembly protein Flp/PilA